MTEQYPEEYWKKRPFETDKFWRMTMLWLDRFEPHSVLDYGCGKGYHVHCWRGLGVDAVGYDISQYAIEHAFDQADGHTSLTLPDGQFDLVTCLDVLEHVEEDSARAIIKEVYEKVKAGKEALFSICFADDPNFPKDNTHILKRTRKWWENEIKKAGFELCPVPSNNPYWFANQMIIGRKSKDEESFEIPLIQTQWITEKIEEEEVKELNEPIPA